MAESQLRKGALELIVLGLLSNHPSYGGELLTRCADEAGLDISSGTMYPLLKRLRKAGNVDTHWEESTSGPPRKVYALTAKGLKRQAQLAREWELIAAAVNKIH